MFGHSIEGLIIKYTLGTCFVGLFVLFGVKMLMLLWTVFSMKMGWFL